MPEVLLVEDDPTQARALMSYFELTEYNVVCTQRLADAVEHIQRRHADAIILDISLPDSQGLDSLLRMQVVARDIPIVILMSTDDKQLDLEMLRKGAQDVLIKGQQTSDWVQRALRYSIERFAAAKKRSEAPLVALPTEPLNVSIDTADDVTIVRVRERQLVDSDVIEKIATELRRLANLPDKSKFVLDCCEVDYLSISALAHLLTWDQTIRKQGGRMRICNLSPDVRDQKRVKKLLAQFDVCPDEETALQDF